MSKRYYFLMDQEEKELEEEEDSAILAEQVIDSWNEYLISVFVGLPNVNIHRAIFEDNQVQLEQLQNQTQQTQQMQSESTLIGNVHYLEHDQDQGPAKRPHHSSTAPPYIMIPKKIILYRYLKLSSHEYRFTEDEGKEILLTPTLEPNLYIRKLVERIPSSIRGRMEFLSRFLNESDNRVLEVDSVESSKMIHPSEQFTLNTIFTNLKEQLFTAYIKEMRLRRAFRNVLQRWRIYQIDKKESANIDPITLIEPKKQVVIYDIDTKTRYIFDATSLATWIESNLNHNEGGFAVPMNPRNPWTNIDFTYPQLIAIYNQLKEHGELRWGFTTFREYNFNKPKWQQYHSSTLTMRAIRTSLTKLDSYDARELLEDFIFSKMDDLHIYSNSYINNAYRQAILRVPNHWYLEEFKGIAFQHYEATHYHHNRHRYIHNRCDRIFQKQDLFLSDLQRLGIIRAM
jgi:hypothetical protein